MVIHYGYDNLSLIAPVVTLGIFDGVHLGHVALLNKLVSTAKEANGESVVITFSPHPRLILQKDHLNLSFLTTMEEKKTLLKAAGVDHLIVLEFNIEFSKIEACDFIREVLVEKIGTRHLIIGHNHHFGSKGAGDFNTIIRCSELLNFKVEQVKGFSLPEGPVSSSVIRDALLNGMIEKANNFLGYNYTLSGTVITGRMLGRTLGFPTANIEPEDQYKLIPSNGVYAVETKIDGLVYRGMLNIGSNPTVNKDLRKRSIEVHILDFEDDIYGKRISVIFRKRLRDEKKFDSLNQLIDQMKLDRENTIRCLNI